MIRCWLLAGLMVFSLSSPAATRIVSLAPFLTDIVIQLQAEDRLVGVMDDHLIPERLARVPRVGGYRSLSLESILAQRPDLVLAWTSGNDPQTLAVIESWGITVMRFDPQGLLQISDTVRELGHVLDAVDKAAQVVAEYEQALRQLAEPLGAESPRVFIQVWDEPLYTVAGGQMVSQALYHCGANNIFHELPGLAPQVSRESVLAANPDLIILLGDDAQQPARWREQWLRYPQLKAVASNRIHTLNSDHLVRPTPAIIEGVAALCAVVRGEKGVTER